VKVQTQVSSESFDRRSPRRGAPDFTKCDPAFSAKWSAAETKGNGQCPTTGDQASIQTRITTDSGDLAVLLSGGSVSVCGNWVVESGEECDLGNLNGQTCQTKGFVGGGQLSCTVGTCVFDTSGCFATQFVDNGDGTVTDHLTGLQWEKKTGTVGNVANPNDPHDVNTTYRCASMPTTTTLVTTPTRRRMGGCSRSSSTR
jgi:hypothetical protein